MVQLLLSSRYTVVELEDNYGVPKKSGIRASAIDVGMRILHQ